MKVIQLWRLLRTQQQDMRVLLKNLEGISGAHEDDFEQLELSGQWGPKALVLTTGDSRPTGGGGGRSTVPESSPNG